MNNFKFRASLPKPGVAIMLLFSLFAFFLILTPILTTLLTKVIEKPDAALRIAMVVQDLLVFILPTIITAIVVTKLPAQLLCVASKFNIRVVILSLVTLLAAIPVMNFIINWNESIHLPESMSNIEAMFRQLENNAQMVTNSLMAGASIPSLIVSVLIVGVLAGFSEELFFRGAMQRILTATNVNLHAAVWIVAFIFSLFHFQFFGFVPRLLLGAYFGYLLLWSRSLWIPVIVHVFNNSIVVITTWSGLNNPDSVMNIDKLGTDIADAGHVVTLLVSIVLTVFALYYTRKECLKS